ncbi:MAG: response regulator [Armatimonadetes bacterium]|nr:response regulator [Armatimonadota bacterium]
MEKKVYRTLIADDEELAREALRCQLESLGHEVVGEAKDGDEAVRLAADLHPDIVLLDVRMPVKDGIAAGKEIMEEAKCPVLLFTGFTDEATAAAAARAGAFYYLTKPVKVDDLEPGILICVQRHKEVETARGRLADIKLVQRAKGVLMDHFGLTEQEAHDRIHRTARGSSRTMAAVAMEVIEKQQIPS